MSERHRIPSRPLCDPSRTSGDVSPPGGEALRGSRARRRPVRVPAAVGLLVVCLAPVGLLGAAGPDGGAAIGSGVAADDDPGVRHTELRSSVPAAGATVDRPVAELRLVFTTAVQLPLSRVQVQRAGADDLGGDLEFVEGADSQELRFSPATPLEAGSYRVVWQTAGPDSHIIRGEYAFTVVAEQAQQVQQPVEAQPPPVAGQPAPSDTPGVAGTQPPSMGPADTILPPAEPALTPEPATTAVSPVVHAIRWMQYLGTLLALGAVAFRFGVVSTLQRQSALGPAAALMLGRLVGLAGAGALFLAVSLPGRLWSQSVATWGSDALGAGNLWTLIFRTPWGWGWLLQLAAVIVLLLGVRFTAPGGTRKVGWYVLAAGGLMAAFVPSFSGHAWGIQPLLLGVLVSAGHSLGASIWMGALAALLLAGLPGIRAVRAPDGSLPGLGALVNAFSRIALPAVVLVVLTGAVQNFFLLGGLGNVFSTGWGRTLLVKLGLVAAAMALGLYNWRVVRPALETTPRAGLLRIPATVEFLLGLCVLAATAVLVSRALP